MVDYLFHFFVFQKKHLGIVFLVPVAENVIKKWAETDLIAQVVSVRRFTLYITFFFCEFTYGNRKKTIYKNLQNFLYILLTNDNGESMKDKCLLNFWPRKRSESSYTSIVLFDFYSC